MGARLMDFINMSGTIGLILAAGTQNLTGDLVATLFLILLFLIVIAFMFQIPLEFLSVLILPFCLSVGAFYSNFMIPIIVILLYVASLIAKNWLFR